MFDAPELRRASGFVSTNSNDLTLPPLNSSALQTLPGLRDFVQQNNRLMSASSSKASSANIAEDSVTLSPTTSVGFNVNISQLPGNQSEGTISINPTNPLNIVALSNLDSGTGLFETYSLDRGTTWTTQVIGAGGSLGEACCDPSLSFDDFGNLFLTYITDYGSGFQVGIALSTDCGATFSSIATLGTSGDVDQPSITTGAQGVWVTYTEEELIYAAGAAVTGLGTVESFSTPSAVPGSTGSSFGDIAIGPTGEVMVTYQNRTGASRGSSRISVNVDPDGLGSSGFGSAVTVTRTNVTGFDYIPAQSSRSVDAEANLAWDRTGGLYDGRVYLVYTNEMPDESNNTDIYLRFSDDSGTTWSSPVRVNDDLGTNSQFLPKIAVDQTTGYVAVSWHDARNDTGSGSPGDTNGIANDDAQLYASVSFDGGMSFQTNLQVSAGTSNADSSPDPAPGVARLDYGDYTGLAFNNGNFYPVWADNSNSTGDNPQGALSGFDLYTAQVSIALTPSNDNLSNSVGLTGAALRTSGTNTNATLEADEPNIGGIPGGNSVWWSWTAPFSGSLTINTFGSDFNTLLGVFTTEADGLNPVASNDDASGTLQSRVTFDVAAGTTYLIDVDGYQGASGKIALALKEIPFNNKFAQSITLTGNSVSTSGTNINATIEAGEPNISGIPGGHSVWWSWTAPFSGTTTLNTFGSDFDTLLGVFTGSTVSSLTPVASNDDAGGMFQSEVTFEVVAGTIYRINVDGYQRAFGNIALTLNAVPLSDSFALTGTSLTTHHPKKGAKIKRR